jgi:DNA-binding phage protein
MPLSRDFNQTVRERAERDPVFRHMMLQEALVALSSGEAFDAKVLLRDFINATLGFPALGSAIGRHPKSLMRMFSSKGNPSLDALSAVLKEIARREGYIVKIEQSDPLRRPSARGAARTRKDKAAA